MYSTYCDIKAKKRKHFPLITLHLLFSPYHTVIDYHCKYKKPPGQLRESEAPPPVPFHTNPCNRNLSDQSHDHPAWVVCKPRGKTPAEFAALVSSCPTGTGELFDKKRLFFTKRINTDVDKCRFFENQKGALLEDKPSAFWGANSTPFGG